jgi:hypothetical protein
MSLLTIIQYTCRRTGVPVPSTVHGNTDVQILQMEALLEEEGQDLARRGAWQGLTFEATHTTVATENQGAMSTIASNGFNYVKNQTIWDRTDRLPVLGPMDAQDWQAMKAVVTTGPRYQFRIRGGKLIVNPVPSAGHTWAFEYVSKNFILAADAITYKEYFTLDTDTVLLPEDLMIMGLRWRWMREKGLDYGELFRSYEMQVKDALGRDGGKPILHMDNFSYNGPQPGIFIPSGNWNIP